MVKQRSLGVVNYFRNVYSGKKELGLPSMSHFNDTADALSQITDEGLFEHLAAAVLRGARPEIYANLTQPGTNAQGKPVKSPVDAISFVANSLPRHMVTAHHTTCKQGDLGKKWLHDPSAVIVREGRKATAPAGDLVKTAEIAGNERLRTPDLLVTLALTTNTEPSQKVTRDAEHLAASHRITLDIWSRSRIASYLDDNPNGQWLRRKYLDRTQERLSVDLLREIGKKSLEAHQLKAREAEQITRSSTKTLIDRLPNPVGFLVGQSGFGKSVACFQYLSQHWEGGGHCLVLPHEVLAASTTLDQAIDGALRPLHPSLAEGSGSQALALCSENMPLLIAVEDVSRSGQSTQLIERLVRWSVNFRDQSGDSHWRIICPIWPELFNALRDDTRKCIEPLTQRLETFSPEEARDAVLRRATLEQVELSDLDAQTISQVLGYDPLLIGLHNLKEVTPPGDVISNFIAHSTERVSENGTYFSHEYAMVLRVLAGKMLSKRRIDPKWSEVLEWFSHSSDQLASLRELVKHSEVIRMTNSEQDAQLRFRHDRVRKALLIDAATNALNSQNLEEHVFSDPFFADVIGAAMARASAAQSIAERARHLNPLALFYCLQAFAEPSAPVHDAVQEQIRIWLADKSSHSRGHQSLRHAALGVLSETQSSHVCRILPSFRDRSWAGNVAGLRNGDLRSGVQLCASLDPGSGALWRDRAIEHAKINFGVEFTRKLSEFLKSSEIGGVEIVGSLRLAGHLAETSLADSIRVCWHSDTERTFHLDAYLWAAAQCGGEQTEELLSPICDAWSALPAQSEKEGMPSSRHSLAADHVAWAFWKVLPEPALRYFIHRAVDSRDLRWPIVYMLRGVDHPDAVEFLVEYLSEISQRIEGTDGFNSFSSTLQMHWQDWNRERNKPMSPESRKRLYELWIDGNRDKHIRKHSFQLWAATQYPGDLTILRDLGAECVLNDAVLRARLMRSDQTAIPQLIEKLNTEEKHRDCWWELGRHIWSDALTSVVDSHLRKRAESPTLTWKNQDHTDWILPELIMRLDTASSEALLCKHWDSLRLTPNYVQAALYVATPRLLQLVNATVQECPRPADLFEHIDMHFGIKTVGRSGITRQDQIQGLVPFLDHLTESSIHAFWEVCNERGWIEFRREHLDSRLGEWSERVGLNDENLLAELDKELSYDRHYWLDHWVDRHLDHGRSKEEVLNIVRQWLGSNMNSKALQIAASIIIYAGTRADLEILSEGGVGEDMASAIISDARFAVERRTLV